MQVTYLCFKGLQTSCMVWRWNRHYSTYSGVNIDDYHKKAHESYCFSSPSLQTPPTLQIAHEGHLQNTVAEFGLGLFFYLFVFLDRKSKQGRNIFVHWGQRSWNSWFLPVAAFGFQIPLAKFWGLAPTSKLMVNPSVLSNIFCLVKAKCQRTKL